MTQTVTFDKLFGNGHNFLTGDNFTSMKAIMAVEARKLSLTGKGLHR